MDEVTTIDVARKKLEELIKAIPSAEPKSKEELDKKKVAVNAAVEMSKILGLLEKDDLEREKVASAHELKLEEIAFNREKLEAETEAQAEKLKVDVEQKALDRQLAYFVEQNKVNDAVRKAQEEARRARREWGHDAVTIASTVVTGVFEFNKLVALSDVVNGGRIHMKLLPFIGRK